MLDRIFGVVRTVGDDACEAALEGAFGSDSVVRLEEPDDNGAAARNMLLAGADAEFVYMIDDTLVPKDLTRLVEYEGLARRFGQTVMFYGYARGANRVLSIKPNPGVLLRVSDAETLHVTQFPVSSMIVVHRSANGLLFDGTLKHMYLDELLCRSAKEKLIPFNGFYMDVPESWTLFDERLSTKSQEQLKVMGEEIRLEREALAKRGVSVNSENNVNMFIQFVQARLGGAVGK